MDIALMDIEQFATLANAAIAYSQGETYIAIPYQILAVNDNTYDNNAARCEAT